MKERKFTVVVASHKLRELEDICHSIAILHKGGVLTSKDMSIRPEIYANISVYFRNRPILKK